MLIRVKVANIGDPDVEIMWWHVTPYIQYEHIRLDDNFRQYFEASLISLNVSRNHMNYIQVLKIIMCK